MESGLRGKNLGELERLLRLFEAGELSGPLTVARLLLVSRDVASIERWLEGRLPTPARDQLLHLIEQHRHGCQCVAALRETHLAVARGDRVLGAAPGPAAGGPEALAKAELVERATRELVERFGAWGLLGPDRSVLEIGCGAGRLQAALSPKVALAAGVDASAAMVARARWCCSRLPNTRHEVGRGSNLAAFGDAAFQLVFAVDGFLSGDPVSAHAVSKDPASRQPAPSDTAPADFSDTAADVVFAGLGAERAASLAEAARVLSPGGELVFQVRSPDAVPAREDVLRLARQHGFDVSMDGERAFQWWHGSTYRLKRRV